MGTSATATMRLQIEDEELTEEQVQVFTEAFQMFDKDGSGAIDAREFRAVCQEIGMNPTDSELKLMLRDVDKNDSGDVDLQEFITAMKEKYVDNEGPEIIRCAFDVFDTDGSGALSYEEMTDILKNLGDSEMASNPTMIRRLVEAADTDRSGEVDLEEFMAMIQGKLCNE